MRRYIDDIPTARLEQCLAVLERDGITSDPPVPPWPCEQCGNDGVRNVGSEGYCAVHLAALYAQFGPEAWIDGGVGLQTGPLRPEYGPLEAELTCCCCGATWCGIPGDTCGWCQDAAQRQIDHQIDLLLQAPDTDSADTTYEARMGAWVQRMKVGVDAGLIARQQAETAWRRTQIRAVA